MTDSLFGDLPRGRYPGDVGRRPDAYFEPVENLLATESLRFDVMNNHQSKTFCGVVGGRVCVGGRTRDGRLERWVEGGTPIGVGDDRHAILLSGTRGGKGRSFLLPNLALLPRETSIFAIDPKGSLASIMARYHELVLGKDVYVIDPMDCTGERTKPLRRGFDPAQFIINSGRRDFVPNCNLMADAIVAPSEQNAENPHWDETAMMGISTLLGHVATHSTYEGKRNGVSVWDLVNRLTEAEEGDSDYFRIEKELLSNDAGGGHIRNGGRALYERTGTEFSGVVSTMRRHLNFMSIECVQETMRMPCIEPRKLVEGSTSVFSSVPVKYQVAMRGWQRLLLQAHLSVFDSRQLKAPNQCVFVLEEMASLQKMRVLEESIALLAGQGVKFICVLQDLNQLKAKYPNWESFLANAGLVVTFACTDQFTLSYLSKQLGQTATISQSSNATTFKQASQDGVGGASWSYGLDPLMTEHEIAKFFGRDDHLQRQLILRAGFNPMITQRIFLDKHPVFQGRFDEEQQC